MDREKIKMLAYRGFRRLPMSRRRCFFLSDIREDIGGNFLPLKQELEKRGYRVAEDYKASKSLPETLLHECRRMYFLARAKYVFLEDFHRDTNIMAPRPGQRLIQLWHAAGAYKRFAWGRVMGNEKIQIHEGYKKYTDAIVSSEEIRKIYAEAFRIPLQRVCATGIPRTDCFFDEDGMQRARERTREKYPAIQGKKVVLFAPTYRGTYVGDAGYNLDYFHPGKLHERLGEEYVFLVKWHPAQQSVMQEHGITVFQREKEEGYLIDVSDERDINELLWSTDILITDYSSIIFEYALLDRPIVYYWFDEAEYSGGRGLYYPPEEYVYGPVARDEEELGQAILEAREDETARRRFLEKFMSACDGEATRRVAELMEEKATGEMNEGH